MYIYGSIIIIYNNTFSNLLVNMWIKFKHIITIILILLVIAFAASLVYRQVEEYKLQDDPMIRRLRERVSPLFVEGKKYSGILNEINNRDIMREISLLKGTKSYTINKEKIYLCLTDESGDYYNENLLVYVLLHEISHVISKSIGHTEEFHTIFEELLKEAVKEGIFDPTKEIDQNYCMYTS